MVTRQSDKHVAISREKKPEDACPCTINTAAGHTLNGPITELNPSHFIQTSQWNRKHKSRTDNSTRITSQSSTPEIPDIQAPPIPGAAVTSDPRRRIIAPRSSTRRLHVRTAGTRSELATRATRFRIHHECLSSISLVFDQQSASRAHASGPSDNDSAKERPFKTDDSSTVSDTLTPPSQARTPVRKARKKTTQAV